jgi:hypothetical protein
MVRLAKDTHNNSKPLSTDRLNPEKKRLRQKSDKKPGSWAIGPRRSDWCDAR